VQRVIDKIMDNSLPKLTYKQQKFVLRYIQNGGNASEAYRCAYDCAGMSPASINVEASKLLKNPKISLWIDYYRKNVQDYIEEEINYTIDDAFQEFEDLQQKCMKSSKTYGLALKAIENKCKLKGHYKDCAVNISGPTVQMGSVEIDGKELKLNIGEGVNEL